MFGKNYFVIIFTFIGLTANAQIIDYAEVVARSNKLLEKIVNSKPITGCEQEAGAIILERLKELSLQTESIISGDAPAIPPLQVTDPAGQCLDGRQPTADQRPNFYIKLPSNTGNKNLKALMIVAHIDVVTAVKQIWSPGLEAHKFIEKDGFIYGRGVLDMLSYLTLSVELFGEIKKQNLPLERDLILMLNSDEEKGGLNGLAWIIKNRPELFANVEFALSEGGATVTDDAQNPLFIGYEAAQKRYQDFKITATGSTGHSSNPSKIQAADLLLEAIRKIKQYPIIPRLTPLIKSYFSERAKVEPDLKLKEILEKLGNASDAESKNLYVKYAAEVRKLEENYQVLHALIRRTCTTTVVEAGSASAKNTQPQTASAIINCRFMPDEEVDSFLPIWQKKVNKSFGEKPTDPSVKLELDVDYRGTHAGGSDISGLVPQILKRYAQDYFKGIPVIPSMLTAATDLKHLRHLNIQSYGFGPVFMSDNDKKRAHGIDERIYVNNLKHGIEVFSNIVLDIVAPTSRKPASAKATFPGKISKDFKASFGESHESGGCVH